MVATVLATDIPDIGKKIGDKLPKAVTDESKDDLAGAETVGLCDCILQQ
jgi:hypothetical protein